jgi:tetratricopeptide (TPR) repeat protein
MDTRIERAQRRMDEMREISRDSWRYTPSSHANDFRAFIPYEPPKYRPKGLPGIRLPVPFPRDPAMPYYRRGKELFRQGKFAEAREQFLQALRLNPRKGECYSFLGQIYLEQDRNYPLAIDHFRKAISCCSSSTRHISLYYLALTYEAVKNTETALRTWEEYFRICPKGTNWETEAKKHYAALKPAPVPALTP